MKQGVWLGRVVRAVLVLVGLSPFLPPLLEHVPILRHAGAAIDAWFQFQCHREAARSWGAYGHLLPVCSRCFGIYVGLGLGAAIVRPKLGVWPLRIWVGVAALVMVLDVATEGLGMRPESGWLRTLTGLLLAYPVGAALVRAARGEPEEAPQPAQRDPM